MSADGEGSSDDEESGGLDNQSGEVDTSGAIGVSIGREQTRLLSPRTPAIEKVAAIDRTGGFFGPAFDGSATKRDGDLDEVAEVDTPDESDTPDEPETYDEPVSQDQLALPVEDQPAQPAEDEPAQPSREADKPRSILRGVFRIGRRRAASGSALKVESDDSSKLENLSRKPRDILRRSFLSSSRQTSPAKEVSQPEPPPTSISNSAEPSEWKPTANEIEEAEATIGDLPDHGQRRKSQHRPPILRRSTSDTDLALHRRLSRASTLGDDSRFADHQVMSNSRFKAIQDTLRESNIKFPTISGLLRERSNSQGPRGGGDAVNGRGTGSSENDAIHGAADKKFAITHPHFQHATKRLEGDLVILGGYRGSILRSAEPPHRQLWVPIKVGLNLRKVDLEVGIEEDADERAVERVIPSGMLTHIGPVDISRRLFKRLRESKNAQLGILRVHDYGYDWRLHPLHLSKLLISYLESLPCNQPGVPNEERGATVIAHSLGGLITRHAINQRPDLFRGVVFAGVPKTCVNILGPLRNGDDVMLSSRVLTAQVNMTIRTSFALLPLDGRCFLDRTTKEEYPVDFFDIQTWIDYRLSPCIARPLPPVASGPPKPSGIISSVANALHGPRHRGSEQSGHSGSFDNSKTTSAGGVAEPDTMAPHSKPFDVAKAMDLTAEPDEEEAASVKTAVTIPRDDAIAYLTRTLATVKTFKEQLAHRPELQAANAYPPIAVIFGKSSPTVFGAKVDGRDGIKYSDAYDDLAFASGDGVVLARASMVPDGYRTAKGGVVSTHHGHVTLLSDLEAVGKCLHAITRERRKGVGSGAGQLDLKAI